MRVLEFRGRRYDWESGGRQRDRVNKEYPIKLRYTLEEKGRTTRTGTDNRNSAPFAHPLTCLDRDGTGPFCSLRSSISSVGCRPRSVVPGR